MLFRLTCFVVALHAANSQYTIDEVAMHNSKDDCWTVVDSTVYALTEYGTIIQKLCGNIS